MIKEKLIGDVKIKTYGNAIDLVQSDDNIEERIDIIYLDKATIKLIIKYLENEGLLK